MTVLTAPVGISPARDDVQTLRQRFAAALEDGHPQPAERTWRMGCFERGLRLADELESRGFPVAGRRVLDVGAAFGGDMAALCARGAHGVGLDLLDHNYAALPAKLGLESTLQFERADCTRPWPFPDRSFDLVLSLSVLEIIDDLPFFFRELTRVLRPGGWGLIDTGTALRMARRDPLYRLPLISLLPTPLRRLVAERAFGRRYRFHISRHTFYSAAQFRRFVRPLGYTVVPCKFAGSPTMARLSRRPLGRLGCLLLRWLAYDFVLLVPRGTAARRETPA